MEFWNIYFVSAILLFNETSLGRQKVDNKLKMDDSIEVE